MLVNNLNSKLELKRSTEIGGAVRVVIFFFFFTLLEIGNTDFIVKCTII